MPVMCETAEYNCGKAWIVCVVVATGVMGQPTNVGIQDGKEDVHTWKSLVAHITNRKTWLRTCGNKASNRYKKMSLRRNSYDIYARILKVALKPTNKTRLMYSSNMSWIHFRKHFNTVLASGLLQQHSRNYRTTVKGLKFIHYYDMIQKLLQKWTFSFASKKMSHYWNHIVTVLTTNSIMKNNGYV